METTKIDEEAKCRSGISNYYYGGVTNVINLKLSKDQVAVFGSGNNIAETINNLINPHNMKGYGEQ